MNPILQQILSERQVSDGTTTIELSAEVYEEDGLLLQRVIETVRPRVVLEIGMAYGVSSLYIGEALAQLPEPSRHIVIDPYQRSHWRGIGLRNVRRAGYDRFLEFHAERSEIVLPRLAAASTGRPSGALGRLNNVGGKLLRRLHRGRAGSTPLRIDVAFIDGYHSFDQVMTEFFFIHRMLTEGGVCVFHDANLPGVNCAIRHVLTYPCYKLFELPEMPRYRPALVADLLNKSWEEVDGVCVPVQKIGPDQRPEEWHQDF